MKIEKASGEKSAQSKVLDPNAPQKVAYCIPLWLRDEQVAYALKRVKKRLTLPYPTRNEPIACVSYGPSLNDTWEKIRDFKFIITCSGAHKFLIERGIIPTWHLDVDPREHKVMLMGPPHKDVHYMIASTCHPKLWDHLEGFDVTLWHIFDSGDDGWRQLPPGEWAVTGGCSAGLRTLTLARLFGFRELHVFGMDGSDSEKYGKHAAEHPNQAKGRRKTIYEGREFYTTPAFLEAARQTFHELDSMPDVEAVFYGDGLVQWMARFYKRNTLPTAVVGNLAYGKPTTISEEYMRLNAQLHEQNLSYGVGGGKHADAVKKLHRILQKNSEFVSVLDYGCGKGYLGKNLPFPIWEYDPAIPGKGESPRPADIVVCTDVLEHVEPDQLTAVLADLARCTKQIGLFTIHTGPAQKTLPDGRNTHLIQKDVAWWKHKLERFFTVGKITKQGPELVVLTAPHSNPKRRVEIMRADREEPTVGALK